MAVDTDAPGGATFRSRVDASLTLQPIGFIRTAQQVKFHARHQPAESHAETSRLELLPDRDYERALSDLAGFSRIWLVWWFHRNAKWRPMVLPPRGPSLRRGLFATRSPHRPNPLGITPVQLLGIDGLTLHLGPCDLVDGTPVFDIKPYIAAYDSFPDASAGWIGEVDAALREPPKFTVAFRPLAELQAEWLRDNWRIDFRPRLIELLARDPSPHRTRRIKRDRAGQLSIACGAWQAFFELEADRVVIRDLAPTFPRRFLDDPARKKIPDHAAQLAFLERWPPSG